MAGGRLTAVGRKASRFPREPVVSGIRSLTHDGRGVAETEGKTVFVDGALPGETIEWVRMRRKRNYDEARVERVVEPADSRVEPACDVFGLCGGCVMQHLAPAAQLDAREQVLRDNLERIGGVTPDRWLPPLDSPPWHYRRRARLGVRYVDAKQRVLIGFRERYKPYITDMARCPVLGEPAAELIAPLAELVAALSIARRLPQIEVAIGDDEGGAVCLFVLRVLDPPTPEDLAQIAAFSAAHDVWFALQAGPPDRLEPVLRPDGSPPPPLEYRLPDFDVSLAFVPTDFIQVNAVLNRRMVRLAVDLLDAGKPDRVLDLYSGIGNFTLPIARRAGYVLGLEGAEALTTRARQNAARNGIDNAEFETADLSAGDAWRTVLKQSWDRVLLDPARSGAEHFTSLADRIDARRIVYVSCHPGTLARDAGVLVNEAGYRLSAAGVMNMFPHTAHVESIAVFDRDGRGTG
jgi:23S rRNA (uracil1939-C5)-methyltransferase